MKIESTFSSSLSHVTARRRPLIWKASIGVLTAVTINLGLFMIGRVADASFLMEAAYGSPEHQVMFYDVALKTLIPLAIGVAIIVVVATRWSWLTHRIAVAGTVLGLLSGILPAMRAYDTTTAVMIASMHTVASIAFWMIAKGVEAYRSR